MLEPADLSLAPLTPANWPSFVDLMGGPEGGCGGCWCSWWRMPRSEWYALGKSQRLDYMSGVVERQSPGLLAMDHAQAVGWVAVGLYADYPTMHRSSVCRYQLDQATWCISCLFVRARHRRKGLTRLLIAGAYDFATSMGAATVIGFPQRARPSDVYVDRFVGTEASFAAAGFVTIEQRGPNRALVAKTVDGR